MQGILQATIITVDNNVNSPADYTDLQEAIDAASEGDTLYIAGSETRYGTATLTIGKKLVLIGAGYYLNDYNGFATETSTINLETDLTKNANGTVIIGIKGTIRAVRGDNMLVEDVVIDRCQMTDLSVGNTNNWIVKNSIVTNNIGSNGVQVTNFIMANCIIYQTDFDRWSSDTQTMNNILVSNCLFINSTFRNQIFGASHIIKNITFTNSIFYKTPIPVDAGDVDNCRFLNCLTFGPNATNLAQLGGTNSLSSNLIDQDPLFESLPSTPSSEIDYLYDVSLSVNSPGKNAGTEGTDIGVYGGLFPFPSSNKFPMAAVSSLPLVTETTLKQVQVPQDGTITINLKAKISN